SGLYVSRSVYSLSPGTLPRGLGGLLSKDGYGGATPHLPHVGESSSLGVASGLADTFTDNQQWLQFSLKYAHALLSQEGRPVGPERSQEIREHAIFVADTIVRELAGMSSEQLERFNEEFEKLIDGAQNPIQKLRTELGQ